MNQALNSGYFVATLLSMTSKKMLIKDYMFKDVNVIGPDETISTAVKKMVDKKTNSLIVVDENNKPIGLVSARTLIKAAVPGYLIEDVKSSAFDAEGTFNKYAKESRCIQIKKIMNKDFHILTEDDTMIEAAAYSLKGALRIIPVASKETGEIKGAITRTCLKNALYNIIFEEDKINPCDGGRGDGAQ